MNYFSSDGGVTLNCTGGVPLPNWLSLFGAYDESGANLPRYEASGGSQSKVEPGSVDRSCTEGK